VLLNEALGDWLATGRGYCCRGCGPSTVNCSTRSNPRDPAGACVNEAEVEIRYVIPMRESAEHIRFCHLRTNYLPADTQKNDGWLKAPPLKGR
jgi:hypothetical protein